MCSLNKVALFILLLWMSGLNPSAAAPCCSAGAALPSLILNDDRAQLFLSHSFSETVMDARDRGPAIVRSEKSFDKSQVTRLSGGIRFAEFWQAGVGTSILTRSTRSAGQEYQKSGFGDSDLTLGYEFLPEWEYSLWKPHGFVYVQTVVPTGKAIQDPSVEDPADVRGQGIFQNAIGVVLTKVWGSWDGHFAPELRKLHPRSFDRRAEVGGTWGWSAQIGAGYSISRTGFHLGLKTQYVNVGPRSTFGLMGGGTVLEKSVWNTGLDVTLSIQDVWTASLAYSDQTLLGPAKNTTLERTIALGLQRRWDP